MSAKYLKILLPNNVGRAMAAGPGPLNSAAMGPLLWEFMLEINQPEVTTSTL